jgi:alkanesulfonate monooxygenase SsuD/methylene tetrahydromethanopterin reductase-like flavin-dependent oxidoreductase (luciferase family)
VCRPTRKEAEDYFHYFTTEAADVEAIETILALKGVTRENTPDYEARKKAIPLMNIGYPIIGTPDDVAEKLGRIHGAGISGIAFSLVNFVTELPLLTQELLPRLERMGMRAPQAAMAS